MSILNIVVSVDKLINSGDFKIAASDAVSIFDRKELSTGWLGQESEEMGRSRS